MDFPKKQSQDVETALNLEDLIALCKVGSYQAEIQIKSTSSDKQQSYSSTLNIEQLQQLYLMNIGCSNCEQAILVVNQNHDIVMANKAFTEITGYKLENILNQNIDILELKQNDVLFPQQYKDLLENKKPCSGEFFSRKQDGNIYKQHLAVRPCFNEQGEHIYSVLTFSDMTEVMEQLVHFKHLAEFDKLTNLPNRTLLQKDFQFALALAKRNSKRLGLLYIDLNDFKPINDCFGHLCGDEVLKVIANRMRSCVREIDTVARIGGDEFIVLINNIDQEVTGVCASMTEKLKRLIAVPIECGDRTVKISASIGSAKYPDHGSSLDELLKAADSSMYQYKRKAKQA